MKEEETTHPVPEPNTEPAPSAPAEDNDYNGGSGGSGGDDPGQQSGPGK